MNQSASIEQALTSLVPTINGPLPPELVELSLSLLARSRSVASSLKADEEIARPYACAQLACERLKKRLNLPPISPRPPCPPRIYKKLFNYLESALPSSTAAREPQTPRKTATSAPASARTTPKTPLSARRTPHSKRKEGSSQEPPEWTMSTVRDLVKAFAQPTAAPHIYTGVESIFPLLVRMSAAAESPSRQPGGSSALTNSSISDARMLGLIAVILFYVLSRLMDQDITPEQYIDWRDTAVSKLLESPAGKNSSDDEIMTEIEQLMPMAQEEGWLQMEWFLNVSPADNGDAMEGVEHTESDETAADRRSNLKDGGSDYIGLGTMMQDATDYLGERQRADYQTWKAGIMARIEEIEASSI